MANSATAISRDAELQIDQAAHRTAESITAAAQATRTYVDESAEVNRRLLTAWSGGAEAVVRTMFDAQNAAFQAGLALFDAVSSSNRTAIEQWAEATRQTQQALWDVWRASLRISDRAADSARQSARQSLELPR